MALPSLFSPFLAEPGCSAVITDFDGSLAAIVDDPTAAVPLPGVPDVLARLAERFALVWVVSGRPVAYLVDRLGPDHCLSGLYGLERWSHGGRQDVPEAERWRPVVAEAMERAVAELGPLVEDKGLSLTLHYRTQPQRGDEVRAWARAEAEAHGLKVREARASVELHPPVETDKGTEVEALAAGMEAACFIGDDLGDVSAFVALDRLATTGMHTVRVAVASDESPPELLERADLVVEGPDGALELLEGLASGVAEVEG
ncbi:MAG: trehalose-phosphatase [Actinomycetota bacterium]|nr:trehalose-phosphatase [Actinomycetota bacterium]